MTPIILIWVVGVVLICGLLRFGPAYAFIPGQADKAKEESIKLESGSDKENSKSEDEASDNSGENSAEPDSTKNSTNAKAAEASTKADTSEASTKADASDDSQNGAVIDNGKNTDAATNDKKTDADDDPDETSSAKEGRNVEDSEKDKEDEEQAAEDDEIAKLKVGILQILLICLAMTGMLVLSLFLWGEPSIWTAAYVVAFYVIAALPMLRGPVFALAIMLDHAAWMFWVFWMPRFRKQISTVTPYEYVEIVLNAFLIVSGFCLIYYYGGVDNLDFVTYIRPGIYIAGLLAVAHVLFLIRLFRGNANASSRLLMAGAFFFSFACILNRQDVYFAAGLTLILAFLFYYLVTDNPDMLDFMERMGSGRAALRGYRARFIAILVLAGLTSAYFAAVSVARYRTFNAPNFDLGIFAQMYEYMARTGMPLTTTERGYLLSHMYVHFSPIFYLFLPLYMLFRNVEFLLILQAVMVFAGVVPLFLICRHYKLSPVVTFLISCVYLVFPAIGQPLFYDFHENKFIPFFVLWFIYFYLEKKDWRALLFLILSLIIKEDTAIFLIVFAVYRIIGKKDYKRGGILLGITGIYFAAVLMFISAHGMGLVEGHYSMYYLEGESGVFALAKNIILEPGRFLHQVFAQENLGFIFCTLGVLLFIPLLCKDKRRLILLLPYVAFALMTSYPFQHDVGFQYTYGPAVLMLLLFILNLGGLERRMQYVVCLTAVCAGLLMSYAYRGADSYLYFVKLHDDREIFAEQQEFLDSIPDDASVTAESTITPHLSRLAELYEFDPDDRKPEETDYFILYKGRNNRRFRWRARLMGYEESEKVGDFIIYQKGNESSGEKKE